MQAIPVTNTPFRKPGKAVDGKLSHRRGSTTKPQRGKL
jgi:hypothetical protein